MYQHYHEVAIKTVCKSIVLFILLNDQVVQVFGQFLQNGQNHDALYNNYFNNNYSYNNIGRGYIGNGNNYIDRLGQNNQYGGSPRDFRRDPFNQKYRFNQANGREGFGGRDDGKTGFGTGGYRRNFQGRGEEGGGSLVMAWDLRDENTDSWGRSEWDSWFNKLEIQLGFRQVGGGDNFSNRPSGERSRGPMDFDMNWPEWHNIASIQDESQIDRNFVRKATYPNEYEQQMQQTDNIPESSVTDGKNPYDDVMGDLMERPVIKSYFLRRKSHKIKDKNDADVWQGELNADESKLLIKKTQFLKEDSRTYLGDKNEEESMGDLTPSEEGKN